MYFCAKAFFMDLLKVFLSSADVCTDTRKIKEGEMFFALKGDNFDGNQYALAAIGAGAKWAVVDDPAISGEGLILVEDVLKALQNLALAYRNTFEVPVLAITGSNGKTTTKELTAAVISKKFNPLVTQGNLNNHIGVPLTLLSAKADHDFFIIEMGANHQGEIDQLCRIARPDFGLISNIGRAHLEGFGGVEGIKKGKSELYRFLAEVGGKVFLNETDEVLKSLLPQDLEYIYYNPDQLKMSEGLNHCLRYESENRWVQTQLFGSYNISNIAAALSIGNYFGLSQAKMDEALSSYEVSNNRSQRSFYGNQEVIKDAYNANPSSVDASLRAFLEIKSSRPKMIILGDMLELGEESQEEHLKILELLKDADVAQILYIGPRYNLYKNEYKGLFFEATTDARQKFKELIAENEYLILLKGSRGIAVEKILE